MLSIATGLARAADPPVPLDRPTPPRLDDSVNRGLAYLARIQRADGAFVPESSKKESTTEDDRKYPAAVTALGLLAFLSAGHTQDVGRYGLAVRSATDLLVAKVPKDGYIGATDESRMYGQAIVTLALAEAHGVEPLADRRARQADALRLLVGVLLKAQAVKKEPQYAGGWRYTPDAADSDISLSGWCALALRAAQDVGIPVPKESISQAAAFVVRCQDKEKGGFAYQPAGAVTTGTTGTAVLCLHLLDRGDQPETASGLKYLLAHPTDDSSKYPFYSIYYATQAAWQGTDEHWVAVSRQTLDRLIKSQAEDGSWPQLPNSEEAGRPYRTALAVLTLTVPYRLLPIYQR